LGKTDRPWRVTSSWYSPFKSRFSWSAVVFFACEIIQLFSAVFCAVAVVHEFEF